MHRIKLNLQHCLPFPFSVLSLSKSLLDRMLFFIYVFVLKESNFSRGHNKFLDMGNSKDLVSNLVKLDILRVIAFLMKSFVCYLEYWYCSLQNVYLC